MTRWPDAVWASPWLRAIDASAREAIEAAGTLRSLARGARVFGPGEPADAVFVVSEGLVDVRAVRRGETEARSIRRAVAGDTLGEEAIVRAGALRAVEASCATAVVLAEVPAAVFRRAVGRVIGVEGRGASGEAGALEAALQRAAGRDVLRTSSVGHALADVDVEALVAASEARVLSRGEVLFAAGDPAGLAFVVADGMVEVREAVEGKARVRAYLSRGDLVADGALEGAGAHDVTVAASGPAWVLAVPGAELVRALRRSPGALDRARRLARSAPVDVATRHVLGDLWRFATAGSMLVIDDEACVRCGACAAACAGVHDDGVSRLVRRGEKVAVRDAQDGSMRALLVPGSCQHCKHPACMIDCPTGAIGRDPGGNVFIREDLCVGCGRCVSACPWGSVQMAPRAADGKRRLPVVAPGLPLAASAEVAVKCDLCVTLPAGPACVSACPVDAIARIEPEAAISEVRRAMGRHVPRRALPRAKSAAWWVAGAAVVALALATSGSAWHSLRMVTGVASGLLVVALASYAVLKRIRGQRAASPVSRVRPHAVAHATMGVVAAGVVAAHAGFRAAPNAAGALLLAFVAATLTGIAGAVAYRLVPKALSRVERRAMLREDLASRARDLDDRAFGALTGRSEATKAVYRRWLAPYARSPLGALALVARRTTLRDEERLLRGRVEAVLGARTATVDGLDDLVRLAVERRAARAQWLLQTALQGWLPVHVVAVAVTVALLALHVVLVTRGR